MRNELNDGVSALGSSGLTLITPSRLARTTKGAQLPRRLARPASRRNGRINKAEDPGRLPGDVCLTCVTTGFVLDASSGAAANGAVKQRSVDCQSYLAPGPDSS